MKRILCFILILILLTGCGNISKKGKINKDDKIPKYSLISTENRLVFKNGNNYEVVYYENNKIVKVESVIKFNTKEEAQRYYKEESYGNSKTIRNVYDCFITEELDDYWEDFKDLNPEELKNYFKNANFTFVE